jgi:hypothetical protein
MQESVMNLPGHRRTMNNSLALLLLLFVPFGFQCAPNKHSEIKILLELPMKQQEEKFGQLPLDKQVDVYVEAMYVEPPQTRYASYLARNGKKLLPFLVKKLQEGRSDAAKADIVYVFKVMHENYYSLSDDSELLESLRKAIREIKNDYYRKMSEEYLRDILAKPGFHSA